MRKLILLFICFIAVHTVFSQANITFKVDMNSFANFNPANGVYIAGATPFSWTGGQFTQMFDADGDSIYEVTLNGVTQSTFEYKFVNGNAWNGLDEKMKDVACKGSGTNRKATISPTTTDTVLSFMFNACDPAGTYYPPLVKINVKFLVDVEYKHKVFNVDFTKVYIAGEFNEWSDDTLLLENNNWMLTKKSDYVYEGTFLLEGNKTYLYKVLFNNGSKTAKYEQTSNRLLTLGAKDTVLGGLCFENDAYPCPLPKDPADVTFRVSIPDSLLAVNDSIYVMGTFAEPAWQDGAVLMTKNNGVYEVTIQNVAPETFLYRFMYGKKDSLIVEFTNVPMDSSLVGCVQENDLKNGLNRYYTRLTSDTVILDVQPFGGCYLSSIHKKNIDNPLISVFPNPFSNYLYIKIDGIQNIEHRIRLVDITGKELKQMRTYLNEVMMSDINVSKGMYFLIIENNQSKSVRKIVVE